MGSFLHIFGDLGVMGVGDVWDNQPQKPAFLFHQLDGGLIGQIS